MVVVRNSDAWIEASLIVYSGASGANGIGRRHAAGCGGGLNHEDVEAGLGQICGRDQPVVSGSDDDNVGLTWCGSVLHDQSFDCRERAGPLSLESNCN